MIETYCYQVQQFERKEWRTKLETTNLDLAYQEARQRHAITLERIRVIRVEIYELIKYV